MSFEWQEEQTVEVPIGIPGYSISPTEAVFTPQQVEAIWREAKSSLPPLGEVYESVKKGV